MPKVSDLFFKTAIVWLILGIGAGLQMAISGDHGAFPAHAHINLLGWVTSAIFGGYYALNPAKAAENRHGPLRPLQRRIGGNAASSVSDASPRLYGNRARRRRRFTDRGCRRPGIRLRCFLKRKRARGVWVIDRDTLNRRNSAV